MQDDHPRKPKPTWVAKAALPLPDHSKDAAIR
jgi:hypothetical protein